MAVSFGITTRSMAHCPNRRWFQFRLRALLVGVVLIGSACGYFAHEWHVVTARKEWLARHPQGMFDVDDTIIDHNGKPIRPPEPTVPFIRRWLGDEPTKYLVVETREDDKSAMELFPEARIFAPWRPFGFETKIKIETPRQQHVITTPP